MLRQIVISSVSIIILIAAFFVSSSISKRTEQKKKPEPEASTKLVQVINAKNKEIQAKVAIFGRLVAFEKTELFAEVGGLLQTLGKPFREGVRYNKGELILRIDDAEQQLNLRAQRAALLTIITQMMPDIKIDFSDNLEAWDSYRKGFDVEKELQTLPTPKSDREKDYVTLKNVYNQYYNIKSLEERLSKYQVYAPFGGELTEALISTGSLIRAGQKIGTLMNTGVYELQASIPLPSLKYVKVGDRVSLQSEEASEGTWTGSISRISSSIDTRTQTVKLFIQVSGNGLRENMFLSGEINATTVANVIEIPRSLLVNDSSVFVVVGDTTLVINPVQPIKIAQTTALVRGIADDTKILSENFPGAFEGMKVRIVESNDKN